jgi:putative lipoprotein
MGITLSVISMLGLLVMTFAAMPAAAADVSGTWVRQAPTVDLREGMVLDSDGSLGLPGIHSITGVAWAVDEGETLVLTTNTERHPEPQPSRLTIAQTSTDTLTLIGEDYLAGTWQRDDAATGRVDGTVVYRERMLLPPDATLRVDVRDVSRADAPSVLLGGTTIPIGQQGPPYAFRVHYFADAIDPRFTYGVSAVISDSRGMIFRNTTMIPVITRGAPTTGVEVLVRMIRHGDGAQQR